MPTGRYFEESRHDRDFNGTTKANRVEQVKAYSVNIDFNKNIDSQHHLIYGLEFVYDDVNSSGTDENILTGTLSPGPSRYPQSTWSSYAAYLTYQLKASEQLMLQAGMRWRASVNSPGA